MLQEEKKESSPRRRWVQRRKSHFNNLLFSNYCGGYTIKLSHYKVLSTLRATIFFASMLHGLLFRELPEERIHQPSPDGIRSFRLKVGSPDSSSPKLSRFARSVFVVLWAWKKGNKHGKTVTAHVESRANSNNISKGMFIMLYVIGRIDLCLQCVLANAVRRIESIFGRNDRISP